MKLQSSRIMMFVLIGMIFLSVSFVYAETIILKSGKTIEGKLTEKTDKYIKIDFQGEPLIYSLDEIESIDGKRVAASSLKEETPSNLCNSYFKQGTVFLKQGIYEEAIKQLEEAVKCDSAQAGALHNLAVAYACKGDYARAIAEFQKVLQKEDADYINIVYYNLATVYCYAGLLEEASKAAEKIKSTKLTSGLHTLIATKKTTGTNATAALDATSFPPDTVILAPLPGSEKTRQLLKEQEAKSGEKIYFAKDFPLLFFYHSPLSYLNLAISSFLDKKDYAESYSLLESAYNAIEDKTEYLNRVVLLGVYLYRGQLGEVEKKYDEARGNFKKAIEISPDAWMLHLHLGIVDYLLGYYEEAKSAFNKVLITLPAEAAEVGIARKYLKAIEERTS